MHGGFHRSNMKQPLSLARIRADFALICEFFSTRSRRGFLKVRIVSKRFLFERIRRSESDIEKSKREGA
jgi:hypothetical protein